MLPIVCRARRLIMAGDHLQLPPVVLSQAAQERGLGTSLLERLANKCPSCVRLLSTQYRSNQLISAWSSKKFYGGHLVAAQENSGDLLHHLLVKTVRNLWTDTPMLWLDSKNCQWEEQWEDEESVSNCDEAILVADIVGRLLRMGVKEEMMGVISPYWAQVALIRSLVWEGEGSTGVEIRTVDGYQGREKEVIILSMVRSNSDKEVGFLSESRRVNVSVTRAKRCCIIIGDSDTLRGEDGLDSLWRFCNENNLVKGVMEEEIMRS